MGVTANAQRGSITSAIMIKTFVVRRPFAIPPGNTMELSNQFDHAWLNGSNEYLMSDDANFNPNGVLNGNGNQLQLVRPAP